MRSTTQRTPQREREFQPCNLAPKTTLYMGFNKIKLAAASVLKAPLPKGNCTRPLTIPASVLAGLWQIIQVSPETIQTMLSNQV